MSVLFNFRMTDFHLTPFESHLLRQHQDCDFSRQQRMKSEHFQTTCSSWLKRLHLFGPTVYTLYVIWRCKCIFFHKIVIWEIYLSDINPRYVLRNWMAESAIRKAETNDFSEVWSVKLSLNACRRSALHWFKPCFFFFFNDYQVGLLHQVLSSPFVTQETAESAGYAARPPTWAGSLKVSCSSWMVHGRQNS